METKKLELIERIVREVANAYRPTSKEVVEDLSLVEDLKHRLKKFLPKEVELSLVGSIAKNTQLRNERDADLFLLFPKSYNKEKIASLTLKAAKKALKRKEKFFLRFANHPYATIVSKGLRIDVVPAYRIKKATELGSAVDRSPFHAKFINENFDEYLRDNVRALKIFLKRNLLYGAESKIKGFSGYLCEVLILYYGSFSKLVEEASKWKGRVIIDYRNKGKEKELEKEYEIFEEDFVVVDPTDKKRNIAAQVSKENFIKFILLCRSFLKKPSKNFFKYPKKRKKVVATRSIVLVFDTPKGRGAIEDVYFPQLNKSSRIMEQRLLKEGFDVLAIDFFVRKKKTYIVIRMNRKEQNAKKIFGPSFEIEEGVEKFFSKHKNAEFGVENGRVFAIEEARFKSEEDVIKDIIKNKEKFGIPKYISFSNLKVLYKIPSFIKRELEFKNAVNKRLAL
ncbi:MAG: CCA tRNA nucleotidyltransferase [Candidatus Micrarchaeales archaeon]